MATKVDRITDVRTRLSDSYKATKVLVIERNELLVELFNSGYSVSQLIRAFGMTEANVRKVLDVAEPIRGDQNPAYGL